METLPFGKYKGTTLEQLPSEYLLWLAGYDYNIRDLAEQLSDCGCDLCVKYRTLSGCSTPEECESFLDQSFRDKVVPNFIQGQSKPWWTIFALYRNWVFKARDEFKKRHICRDCLKKLVPIGTSRRNGAWHNDWDDRLLHKQCWKNRSQW